MKKLVLGFTLLSTLSMAAETAIITKSSGGGFMPPQYQRSEQCEVFKNRVVITRHYGYQQQGGAVLKEVRAIQLQADVNAVLAAAAKEELKTGSEGPCDIPTTSIVAGKETVLFQSGACGSKTQYREGAASRMLTEIVDLYCPKTYKFGSGE